MLQCKAIEFVARFVMYGVATRKHGKLTFVNFGNKALAIVSGVELVVLAEHDDQRAGDITCHTEADIATGVDHSSHRAHPGAGELRRIGKSVLEFVIVGNPIAGITALKIHCAALGQSFLSRR